MTAKYDLEFDWTPLKCIGVVGWGDGARKLQCRGVLLMRTIVEQGFCAFNRCGLGLLGLILRRLLYLFSFSSSEGDGLKKTEIMSQRAVKPTQTNQPLKSPIRHCFNKAIVRPTFFSEERGKTSSGLEHIWSGYVNTE